MTSDHVARAIALGATYEPFAATQAARLWRRARQHWQRLSARREPQTPQELMVYASSLQHSMPALAAELHWMALRRPEPDG